jgi:hypothetical protein
MKQTAILTTTSLLSILLLTLHITDDIVRGISKAEPSNIALFVLAVLLYGTLVLAERRFGDTTKHTLATRLFVLPAMANLRALSQNRGGSIDESLKR